MKSQSVWLVFRPKHRVIANKCCFNHFKSWNKLSNTDLSGEANSTIENTAIKFIPRFQILFKGGVYNDH